MPTERLPVALLVLCFGGQAGAAPFARLSLPHRARPIPTPAMPDRAIGPGSSPPGSGATATWMESGRSLPRAWCVPGTRAKEQRGFFLFGDGAEDAEFTSPEAIYVTLPVTVEKGCSAAPAVANALLDSIGFKGGRGAVANAVASEMGSHPDDKNGSMFWGIEQCTQEAAVKSFLRTKFGLKV